MIVVKFEKLMKLEFLYVRHKSIWLQLAPVTEIHKTSTELSENIFEVK